MTTTVTVSAHCNSETTRVRIIEGHRENSEKTESYLEDGESQDFVVYDSKFISVDEIPK
jgi:hypothetical protein